jgi:hypothetical protein
MTLASNHPQNDQPFNLVALIKVKSTVLFHKPIATDEHEIQRFRLARNLQASWSLHNPFQLELPRIGSSSPGSTLRLADVDPFPLSVPLSQPQKDGGQEVD